MYRLQELDGIFVDACVARVDQTLAFLSVFGRDTAMQHLRAAISLAHTEHGFQSLSFSKPDSPTFRVLLGNNSLLDDSLRTKVRLAPYGPLAHCFIVDKRCLTLDKANGRATLLAEGRRVAHDSIWATIAELSPVPLLNHWSEDVLRHITGICTPLVSIGKVSGMDIVLPDDFDAQIGALVKQRVLRLETHLEPKQAQAVLA